MWDRPSPFVVCHAFSSQENLTDDKKRSSVPPSRRNVGLDLSRAFCGTLSLYDSIVRGAASPSSPYRAIAPGDVLIRFHTSFERTPAAVLAGFLFAPL
jgi:hypothetical protein